MEELISVIIPVYNVENYLEKCIDSVLKQTYKEMEIILVDDGSTDTSGKLCDKYRNLDHRIKVYHKKNGGLSDARNYGIHYATGKYITFIDSDDIVYKDLISELYFLIKEYKADISICDPIHIFNNREYYFLPRTRIEVFNKQQSIKELLYQRSFLVSAWGKLYSKEIFDNIKFPKGMLFEDVAIMYKLFYSSKKIIYSDAKYYGYMHRENSITTKNFSKSDLDILKICDDLTFFAKKNPEYDAAVRAYTVNANLRVFLNAPQDNFYKPYITNCKKYIAKNKQKVLKDKKIRKKLKCALVLFSINKRLLRYIYPHINRWK